MSNKIELADYFLCNPYQIPDNLIFYNENTVIITDFELNIKYQLPLKVHTAKQCISSNFNLADYIPRSYHKFNEMFLCNGKLYALICDVLYQIDLNHVYQLQKIPDVQASGYSRMCIYKNQILVSNERQFYLWNDNQQQFCEKQFYFENDEIKPNDVHLYSFGSNATVRIKWKGRNCILQLNEPCGLLHAGSQDRALFSSAGFQVYKIDERTGHMLVDQTQEITQITYFLDKSSGQQNNWNDITRLDCEKLEYHKQFLEYKEIILKQIIPNYDQFIINRQEQFNKYLVENQISLVIRDVSNLNEIITVDLNKYSLKNAYQIRDSIILYGLNETIIVDNMGHVQQKIMIQRPEFMQYFSTNKYAVNNNQSWLYNGKVYGYINSMLIELDKLNIKVLMKVPMSYERNNKICIFENQILISTEEGCKIYKDQALHNIKFYHNNEEILTENSNIYSFGKHVIIICSYNDGNRIFVVQEQTKCKLLYCGVCCEPLAPAGAIWPVQVGADQICLINLLEENISFSFGKMAQQFIFVNGQRFYEESSLYETKKEFQIQQKQISDEYVSLHKGECIEQTYQDKFNRKLIGDYVDIFGETSTNLQNFFLNQSLSYSLKSYTIEHDNKFTVDEVD
ncbi:Conserved_hypothetical protein [Hexamita inflata]|uniref:Uncharacterized protein n=1 Tax=Hexamita inflata TaxID=28002 RepID=A0AA86PXL4_9EUKA|nr:Conserved hypothetical protein [Hexamita inflata]CAI9971324.1 Conserved hypothetical protein [Hexamita inflata]